MKFDHVVSRVILDISQPFAACETCGAPVRRDADPTVEWSHMDTDEDGEPLLPLTVYETWPP